MSTPLHLVLKLGVSSKNERNGAKLLDFDVNVGTIFFILFIQLLSLVKIHHHFSG